MSDSAIPLSKLTLRRASREQIIESRKRSFDGFARGTTLEEYLARDDAMDSLPSASNGRLSVWVLVDRESQDGDFLCACRTFKRDVSVVRKSQRALETVVGYGIASVFTPKANRRKGYASHMMSLLHWVLAPLSSLPARFPQEWGAPPSRYDDVVGDAACSILYNDVRRDFYLDAGTLPGSRDGWLVRPLSTTVWDVSKSVGHAGSPGSMSSDAWNWLTSQDMCNIWELDTQRIKSDLSAHSFSDGEDVVFTFQPRDGVADYQVQRLEVYWSKIKPPIQHWGICHTQTDSLAPEQPLTTFAAWTAEFRSHPQVVNSLIITRIRATEMSFKPLMEKILRFASEHGISDVEVWNLESSLNIQATEMGARTFERQDHMSSFKWYGAEDPAHVTWAFNEKFPWC